MAPSAKKIEQALLDGTFDVYSANPDDISVNKVRKHVEEKLDLEDGFLATGTWKSKSKTLIKERVEKLMEGWVPDSKDDSDSNTGAKRPSSEVASPKPKRQKRGPKPKKEVKKPAKKAAKKADSSELSELSELSDEEKPQPKKKKAAAGSKSKAIVSDEEMAEASDNEPSEEKPEQKATEDSVQKDEEDVSKSESASKDDASGDVKKSQDESGDPMEEDTEPKPVIEEEEEYSDVIDEPPKPKRKQKAKKEASNKPAASSKAASKKASAPDDPQEAEIKKLQAQLVKCGIRKLWHNELKKYGDDSRGKIRHLKKMLTDVGMDGRFSEAKAREIKETRELMAEAEAAQEMNKLWGMDKGGRASRSKGKPAKVIESEGSGDEDDKEDEDDEEAEESTYAARRKRAQAELAFLGDDSDSD